MAFFTQKENGALPFPLVSDKLSHAYILSGPPGSGRHDTASQIAAAMVCSSAGKRPCGRCQNCKKVAEGIHPDVITITREADRREIYVAQIRAMLADAAVLPNEAEKKVYIIDQADALNAAAQNAMLKGLEEPPPYVAFLLIAENPGLLLETVRSRCVEIHLTAGAVGTDADPETLSLAEQLVNQVVSGEKVPLLTFLFSLEQLDRTKLKAVFDAATRQAVARLRQGAPGEQKKLHGLLESLRQAEMYLNSNVSSGHIVGLLLAEFL